MSETFDFEEHVSHYPMFLVECALFYMIFWGLTVGLMAFMMAMHLHTGMISVDRPRFDTIDSPLSEVSNRTYTHRWYYGNPAMAFRPLNYDDTNLIWFVPGPKHPETWAPLIGSLDAFLERKFAKRFVEPSHVWLHNFVLRLHRKEAVQLYGLHEKALPT